MSVRIKKMETLSLWTSPRSLWLESADKSQPVISVSRDSESSVGVSNHGSIPTTATRRTIHGVLGMIELPLASFLVVITRKVKVGELVGQGVWRVECVDFIPVSSKSATSSAEMDGHKKCLAMMSETLATPYFYFSYAGDLTRSQQKLHDSVEEEDLDPWRTADSRFIWNNHMADRLLSRATTDKSTVSQFLVQLVHGAVFIQRCSINGKSFVWSLVSRRSRHMTGTRFFCRGAEAKGNAANFCETEQIVEFEGQVASHVQTRGSMPFVWCQTPCIKYMPKPVVTGSMAENKAVMVAHFKDQILRYGEQVIINLINQSKNEGKLEQAFAQLVASIDMSDVHYEAFDFHKECSKMRYDRLILLSDQLSHYNFGYFHKMAHSGSSSVVRQTGVFRTNCMDCLDRTNVVQAYLASEALAKMLSSMGILNANSVAELEKNGPFQTMYRNSWADHANLIAVQYAGTGALKTDYTRTGTRTHWGLMQDGWNSGIRYFKNNFYDGQRTDGIKFLLGELTVGDVVAAQKALRAEKQADMVAYLPHLMLTFLAILCFTLLTTSRLSASCVFLCTFSMGMMVILFKLLEANSSEFVNYPIGYPVKKL